MKRNTTFITFLGCAALAVSPLFTGCERRSRPGTPVTENVPTEFLPATLGLPGGTESLGKDEMGRYWYKTSGEKGEQWMYDPKEKTLYSATKDGKSGEWKLTAKSAVTASSLGLAKDSVELGKDANGLYWFVLPSGDEGRAYDSKNKTLYSAKKDSAGQWELGPPVTKP